MSQIVSDKIRKLISIFKCDNFPLRTIGFKMVSHNRLGTCDKERAACQGIKNTLSKTISYYNAVDIDIYFCGIINLPEPIPVYYFSSLSGGISLNQPLSP